MVLVSQGRVFVLGGALLYVISTGQTLNAQSLDQPITRMRPIGAPSAVDQYRPRSQPVDGRIRQTAYQSPVRQTVMLQSELSSPPLPMNPSAPITLPANPSMMPVPATQLGAALPANPSPHSQSILTSDVQPVPQPQLGNQFATIDNCNLVSPASGYSGAFQHDGCGNVVVPQAYAAPQPTETPLMYSPPAAEVAVPVVVPAAPRTNAHVGAPMRSIITFGQERNPVQVGQGLVGQPVAYVPGQPLRNWLRYFMP